MTSLVVSFLAASTLAAAELPPALAHLAPVLEKQEEFVAGIRAYAKAQIALLEQERRDITRLQQEGKPDEAKTKQEQIRKRLADVRLAYETGLDHYNGSARLHTYYGELLYDYMGDATSAVKHWYQAISHDPRYAAPFNNLAMDQFHIGGYENGLRLMDEAIRLDSKNPDYLLNLADIYLIHGPQVQKIRNWKPKKVYREAMKLSKKAADLAPDEFEMLQNYALNFFAAERFEETADWKTCAKAWERARTVARNTDETFYSWLNEARAWIEAKDNANATRCLNEALKLRPGNEVATRLLARIGAAPQKDAA